MLSLQYVTCGQDTESQILPSGTSVQICHLKTLSLFLGMQHHCAQIVSSVTSWAIFTAACTRIKRL